MIKSELQLFDQYYIGQRENIEEQIEKLEILDIKNILNQWHNDNCSTIKLAAFFPLFIFVMWIVIYDFLA